MMRGSRSHSLCECLTVRRHHLEKAAKNLDLNHGIT